MAAGVVMALAVAEHLDRYSLDLALNAGPYRIGRVPSPWLLGTASLENVASQIHSGDFGFIRQQELKAQGLCRAPRCCMCIIAIDIKGCTLTEQG